MVATLNYIYIWLKLSEENYDARRVAYITSMKEMLKLIHLTMNKTLMTEIGGGWYMEKSAKGLPPLRISTLSK